jgi:hypothetical protein
VRTSAGEIISGYEQALERHGLDVEDVVLMDAVDELKREPGGRQ